MNILLDIRKLELVITDKIICRDLNFQIQAGEIWGILGPNGCGKTTLLHALANLHPLTTGEIFLRERNLSSISIRERAQQIGILFQDSSDIFSQTVFEFCLAGRHPHLNQFAWEDAADKNITRQALAFMQLENFSERKVETLSGGERRRLSIAAVLTQTPTIYLLDEPTNHLDISHQTRTLKHFKKLAAKNGVAIIASLHDINMAQYFCDKVLLLMPEGNILQGEPQTIFNKENLERLYQHPLHAICSNHQTHWFPEYNINN
jgi:iron complex transport system ATP-binding protein